MSDHRKRRFDRDHPAICGFIVTRASAHVYDALSITQGGIDQPLDTRVWPAGLRITGADTLVYLVYRA